MPLAAALADSRAQKGRALARAGAKGRQTHAAIVEAALAQASHEGLESLSIGALAERLGMSKSGVFAHFGSREALQIEVVRAYQARFEREVFLPALQAPRGLPRLRRMFELWLTRMAAEVDQGCLFVGGAIEFDDRPGPVRDALLASVQSWLAAVRKAVRLAQAEGHMRAEADVAQIAFELHALVLAMHHSARFLRLADAAQRARTGFDHVLARYVVPDAPAPRSLARAPASDQPGLKPV